MALALQSGKKARPRKPRGGLVAALDVGTTKACCFIGRVDEGGMVRVVGAGFQASQGLRAGTIVDMDATAAAIGHAVNAAEQMSGENLREVIVNVSGGQPTSQTIAIDYPLAGREVGEGDLQRAAQQARQHFPGGDQRVVHALPVGYGLDGTPSIVDPRGMFGDRLEVRFHVVTAAAKALRNLETCIARCHLSVEGMMVSPYAAGLACLVEDEKDLGCVVIDMGGGTTSFAVFSGGRCVHTDSIPLGGGHVTNDIARGLTTPVAYAERMKTLYGHAVMTSTDERDTLVVPQVGEEDEPADSVQVPKSLLVQIIRPRLEEIFELVRQRLEASGTDKLAGRRVVLTGGACQMPGMRELAQEVLGKKVRIGKPTRILGLTETPSGSPLPPNGPALATCAGLLLSAVDSQGELPGLGGEPQGQSGGLFGRLRGLWESL
ncbi:MAG TPA: cell division protein FtsA [Alphaproteobacteria bacterium]|nr:cell division protein FtsA [Alphaproteobacteria bacterium]